MPELIVIAWDGAPWSLHSRYRYWTPAPPDCSVSTAIEWVEPRASQNVAGPVCGAPLSSVKFNPSGTVCTKSVRSGWNVAVASTGAFAVTPCARAPESLQDTNTKRESGAVSWGDGASSQWAEPWSHHSVAGAPYDWLSTRIVGPGEAIGEIANLAWNCFLKLATTLRSVSKVTVWVRAPPSLQEFQICRNVGLMVCGYCGSGVLTECVDPITTIFWAGLVYVAPSICTFRPAGFVDAVSVAPVKPGLRAK